MRRALCLLAASVLFSFPAHSQTFVDASTGLPRVIAWGTTIGDYDADGRMDLLCFDASTQWEATLYKNTTNGFTKQPLPSVWNNQGYSDSFWADQNGDGLLDLLLTGMNEEAQPLSFILRQNVDGTFDNSQAPVPGRPLAWVDLDNDGRLDIVTSPAFANGLSIQWQEANGSYNTSSLVPQQFVQKITTADFDSDGDADLVVGGGVNYRIYRNDGFRRFTDTGASVKCTLFRDMNGDGLLDAVYSIEVNPVVTSYVQFNWGSFNFEETALTLDTFHRVSSSGDFDGDGF